MEKKSERGLILSSINDITQQGVERSTKCGCNVYLEAYYFPSIEMFIKYKFVTFVTKVLHVYDILYSHSKGSLTVFASA